MDPPHLYHFKSGGEGGGKEEIFDLLKTKTCLSHSPYSWEAAALQNSPPAGRLEPRHRNACWLYVCTHSTSMARLT